MKTLRDNAGQDLGLVKSAFPFSLPVEGNRHDGINRGVTEEGRCPVSHEATQMSPQSFPPPVLEEQEDLAEGIIPLIEKGRPGQKILGMPNSTALAKMRRRMGDGVSPKGPPASRTERRAQEPDPAPAPPTDDRPRSDPERILADSASGREQELEEGKVQFPSPPLQTFAP